MRYSVFEIEKQLIDVLRGVRELDGVVIKVHAGELTGTSLKKPEMLQTLIDMRRFILIQYLGKTSEKINSTKADTVHNLSFRFYVGSVDVFQLSLAREDAYLYLSIIYDHLQGKWPASSVYSLSSTISKISGKSITDASNTAPIVINCTAHGRVGGENVFVQQVAGNTAANCTAVNPYWAITKIDADHFALIGSTGNGNYLSGGNVLGAITSSGFNPQSGFIEVDGLDQQIVVDTPDLLVYQTDYRVKVSA